MPARPLTHQMKQAPSGEASDDPQKTTDDIGGKCTGRDEQAASEKARYRRAARCGDIDRRHLAMRVGRSLLLQHSPDRDIVDAIGRASHDKGDGDAGEAGNDDDGHDADREHGRAHEGGRGERPFGGIALGDCTRERCAQQHPACPEGRQDAKRGSACTERNGYEKDEGDIGDGGGEYLQGQRRDHDDDASIAQQRQIFREQCRCGLLLPICGLRPPPDAAAPDYERQQGEAAGVDQEGVAGAARGHENAPDDRPRQHPGAANELQTGIGPRQRHAEALGEDRDQGECCRAADCEQQAEDRRADDRGQERGAEGEPGHNRGLRQRCEDQDQPSVAPVGQAADIGCGKQPGDELRDEQQGNGQRRMIASGAEHQGDERDFVTDGGERQRRQQQPPPSPSKSECHHGAFMAGQRRRRNFNHALRDSRPALYVIMIGNANARLLDFRLQRIRKTQQNVSESLLPPQIRISKIFSRQR